VGIAVGTTTTEVSASWLADRSHLLSKDINLDTHTADIANLVEWEDLADICLVAHSYAGYPASGALERIGNRVSSIVWVDALKPADGQKFSDEVPFKVEDGAISIPSPKKVPLTDANDAAWVLSKTTPQPIGPWLQPVKLSGARERVAKKTYIRLPKFPLAADCLTLEHRLARIETRSILRCGVRASDLRVWPFSKLARSPA
jgi:hypothetical protein